ncbi:bacillithiol system redox-active protein YtxJ [Psychrobacillus sp. FJAT-51614]|uniref:Bacillithiol system redox-active protein YtxJ n=1 Tax=Psychrobacillus mangrovi TaxID=3117745 RepID=A0ABU8F344_9BACI
MSTYTEISSIGEWEELLQESNEKPFLLLKHSTTCPISAFAYGEFNSFDSPVDTFLVKVIESREVSNGIESDLGIRHESPQAFLISNGKAVWHTSHRKITSKELAKAVETI